MQRPAWWNPERILLLVVIATTLLYWRDLSYDFLLDDVPLVLTNPALTSWRNLPAIFHTDIFQLFSPGHTTRGAIHYRPVYMTWLLLNARLFGFVLPWWHLTSLLLHLAVTLLIYRLGTSILSDKWVAALAASLFAVHPIHTEPVAYVSASTDLLVTFFLLIALLFYFEFRQQGRAYDFVISIASAAAAMLSKESAGIFPWLLVAYEALRPRSEDQPRQWKDYVWTLPYFAVGAAYVAVRTVLFGFNAGPGPGGSRTAALLDVPLAVLVYMKNLFLPIQLSFFYPAEWSSEWTPAKAVAVVLVVAVVTLIWVWHKHRPEVRLLLVWTGVLFLPPAVALTTFVRDHWVHDRHMYLATVPVCLLMAVLLAEAVRRRSMLAFAGAGIVILLAADTWFQVPRFTDELSVYASAEKVAPRSVNLRRYSAAALWRFNYREHALEEYRKVIELRPASPLGHDEYGSALAQTGREADALEQYKKALALAPSGWHDRPDLLYRTALLEIASSQFDAADAHIREAITAEPETLNYHAALAQLLRKKGDSVDADRELQIEAANRKRYLDRRGALGQP